MIKWYEKIVQKIVKATYKHICEKLKGNAMKHIFILNPIQLGQEMVLNDNISRWQGNKEMGSFSHIRLYF